MIAWPRAAVEQVQIHQNFLDKRLADADSEPWCGVQVIDLKTGGCVQWFRIDGAVGELYDVAVVPGVCRPMSLGFASNEVLNLVTHDPLENSLAG